MKKKRFTNLISNINYHFINIIKNSTQSAKGGIEMKKRTFIIKVLRLIAIILLLLTLLVTAIKL